MKHLSKNVKLLMELGYNVKVRQSVVKVNGHDVDRALFEELYPTQLMSLIADKIGEPTHQAVRR